MGFVFIPEREGLPFRNLLISFILLCFHICNKTWFLHLDKKSRMDSSSFAVFQNDFNDEPSLCNLKHINQFVVYNIFNGIWIKRVFIVD